MAFPGRFERPTYRLGGGCSIRLSYGNKYEFWAGKAKRKGEKSKVLPDCNKESIAQLFGKCKGIFEVLTGKNFFERGRIGARARLLARGLDNAQKWNIIEVETMQGGIAMSLKDEWKNTGKGIGKSFAGLGKSIVKSAKVGIDAVLDEKPAEGEEKKPTGLKESWSEVGHSFGETGKSLGRAAKGTARRAVGKDKNPPAEEAKPDDKSDET